MIKLQDFANQQGVTDRQVQRLLKKYEAELEGLYDRKGPNGTWLTDEACDILRGKMKQAPAAVFEPDPRVGQLQQELEETKAAAKDLWEQMKQKDKTINFLVEKNNDLQIQAASVARLEAANELADRKVAEAEKAAREASEAAKKAEDRIAKYNEEVAAYNALPGWRRAFMKAPVFQED